jgi:hypothetical protein
MKTVLFASLLLVVPAMASARLVFDMHVHTDYPQFKLRQTVDALGSLELDRGEKDSILYETACKLLTPKVPD